MEEERYHQQIAQLQKALRERELHRLDLEKDNLAKIRRREQRHEHLRAKIKALHKELVQEEIDSTQRVALLKSQVDSVRREYDLLSARTERLRQKKHQYEVFLRLANPQFPENLKYDLHGNSHTGQPYAGINSLRDASNVTRPLLASGVGQYHPILVPSSASPSQTFHTPAPYWISNNQAMVSTPHVEPNGPVNHLSSSHLVGIPSSSNPKNQAYMGPQQEANGKFQQPLVGGRSHSEIPNNFMNSSSRLDPDLYSTRANSDLNALYTHPNQYQAHSVNVDFSHQRTGQVNLQQFSNSSGGTQHDLYQRQETHENIYERSRDQALDDLPGKQESVDHTSRNQKPFEHSTATSQNFHNPTERQHIFDNSSGRQNNSYNFSVGQHHLDNQNEEKNPSVDINGSPQLLANAFGRQEHISNELEKQEVLDNTDEKQQLLENSAKMEGEGQKILDTRVRQYSMDMNDRQQVIDRQAFSTTSDASGIHSSSPLMSRDPDTRSGTVLTSTSLPDHESGMQRNTNYTSEDLVKSQDYKHTNNETVPKETKVAFSDDNRRLSFSTPEDSRRVSCSQENSRIISINEKNEDEQDDRITDKADDLGTHTSRDLENNEPEHGQAPVSFFTKSNEKDEASEENSVHKITSQNDLISRRNSTSQHSTSNIGNSIITPRANEPELVHKEEDRVSLDDSSADIKENVRLQEGSISSTQESSSDEAVVLPPKKFELSKPVVLSKRVEEEEDSDFFDRDVAPVTASKAYKSLLGSVGGGDTNLPTESDSDDVEDQMSSLAIKDSSTKRSGLRPFTSSIPSLRPAPISTDTDSVDSVEAAIQAAMNKPKKDVPVGQEKTTKEDQVVKPSSPLKPSVEKNIIKAGGANTSTGRAKGSAALALKLESDSESYGVSGGDEESEDDFDFYG